MVRKFTVSVFSVFLLLVLFGCYPKTEQVYYLPWEAGTTYFCVQGNYGFISHGELNKAAVDFTMPKDTPILAARCGEVVEVITSNTKTCVDVTACPNNEIVIMHSDGTYARYVHINYDENPAVQVGQFVEQGQFIAFSGNIGNSDLPHLHFEVYHFDKDGKKKFLAASFLDVKSNGGVPEVNRFYTSGNEVGLITCSPADDSAEE